MNLWLYILILIFNLVFYGVSLFLIIKNRKHSVISVRSPTLLILNNLGGFLMTSIYISYEMMEMIQNTGRNDKEDFNLFCKIFPNNYIFFHFLMMISFILRCHRIIECCKINYDERTEIKEFLDKRYLFKEMYYIKILFSVMVVILFINLLFNLQFSDKDLNLIPYHFRNCMKNTENAQYYVALSWTIVNFMEEIILLTYTYYIFINHIKQLIKFELFAFMIVWIIYPNLLRFSDFILEVDSSGKESHWTSWACCFFLWICLLLNGYLPIVFSIYDKTSLTYHFNPKLANNLYLFLSNEICFFSFFDYVKQNEKDLYFFNLYIYILKYKFKYPIEEYGKLLEEAKEIYSKFFSSNSIHNYLEIDITNKIKTNCHSLDIDEFSYDMFNEPLILAYEHLNNIYKKYRRSSDYQILIDNLNLNSYIQCKMCNTGLINKF